MNREDVVRASRGLNSNTLSVLEAQLFVWQYCIHRGKDPEKSKLFVTTITNQGALIAFLYEALEWAEKEFSINKLYAAQNMMDQQGQRRLLQIF